MVGKLKQNLLLACLVISSVTVFYLGQHAMECHHRIEERSQPARLENPKATVRAGLDIKANKTFTYHKDMPLIFIGGVPRSGTTLMRAMLDAHPDIRCGEETRVIPRILTKWNRAIETMYNQCMEVGYKKCMLVHYEQLVLHPERWMRTLLKFLHIPWNHSVLHHEEMIGKAGGVSLSKVERSTDQVIKPVNVGALSKWVGKIPPDVLQDMAVIAPMLAKLGYDPYANPPNYGKPDPKILENTRRVYKGEFQLPDFLKEKPQTEQVE